jgi:hypothetical protein
VALSAIGFAATGYALVWLSREFALFEKAFWAEVAMFSLVLMLAPGLLVAARVPEAAIKASVPIPGRHNPC